MISLIDPSLLDNNGRLSDNLGDLIIYNSIKEQLDILFPEESVTRISAHQYFGSSEKKLINNAKYTFVGGTNILTSDIRNFPRFSPVKRKGFYFFPGFSRAILWGVGWVSYQSGMDWATKIYYKRVLRKDKLHSVRDLYTLNKMKEAGFENVIHTSCPTVWQLQNFENKFNPRLKSILFMLTSYNQDTILDNHLLEIILEAGMDELYFFPQSLNDTSYLQHLEVYQKNQEKFILLPHDLTHLTELLSSVRLNYIGSRLHGGIYCMKHIQPSLILSVDNRALEMKKSINLNITERNDFETVKKWITGEFVPTPVQLPLKEIETWKHSVR